MTRRRSSTKPAPYDDRQLSLLDLIGSGKLTSEQKESLMGMLATGSVPRTWRGQAIVPPGTLMDRAVSLFERTTDFPLELPAFMVLHAIAAHLLVRDITIMAAGTRFKPDLWTTLLAPSGAGKTKSASVLQQVMPLRLFPEATTAARFIDELAANNKTLWLQDEWAQLLKRMENQSYAEELRDYILRLHDNKPLTRRTAKNTIEVEDPALVILGTTVYETFCANVSAESMLDGFSQRFGIVIGESDPDRPPYRFPIYRVEEASNLAPLRSAWAEIEALPLHPEYMVTQEAEDEFSQAFRHQFQHHASIPASFFRRIMWRGLKYALVYHVLLGKHGPWIDGEDIGWAMRVSMLHLTDARRLLDGYQMTELEAIIVKAEMLQARLSRPLKKRDLISGVRGIRNNAMAEFVLELMKPYQGASS